jgi:hypothetical protein
VEPPDNLNAVIYEPKRGKSDMGLHIKCSGNVLVYISVVVWGLGAPEN